MLDAEVVAGREGQKPTLDVGVEEDVVALENTEVPQLARERQVKRQGDDGEENGDSALFHGLSLALASPNRGPVAIAATGAGKLHRIVNGCPWRSAAVAPPQHGKTVHPCATVAMRDSSP